MEAMTHILHGLGVGSVLLPASLAAWLDDISAPVVVVP
jgi:hypothetical protein